MGIKAPYPPSPYPPKGPYDIIAINPFTLDPKTNKNMTFGAICSPL